MHAINLAGLPRKSPPINNPSCLKMAFFDKYVETTACSRAEYWPTYTTLLPQTRCKIFSQDVAAVSPLCTAVLRNNLGQETDYFILMQSW